MSTREIAYQMIDGLDEEQLITVVTFINNLKQERQNVGDEVDALCGIFHDVANPDLIPLEKTAWEQAAVEKHIRFLEEMKSAYLTRN